jgi:hypothetical protein
VPTYLGADTEESSNYSLLQRMTVLNNIKNYYLMWGVFFFTIVYSMFGHMLLHLFEEKRRQQSMNISSNKDVVNELHLANHSLLLRGLD